MIETTTGELTMLRPGDLRIAQPPPGSVVVHGSTADVRRLARSVRSGLEADRARARRKAQRAARKRNR